MNTGWTVKMLFTGLVCLFLAACSDEKSAQEEGEEDCNDPAPPAAGQKMAPSEIDCTGLGEKVFEKGVLHRVEITVSKENWDAVTAEAEAYAEDECKPQNYYEAGIKYDDLPALSGVGIRIKGNHAVQNAVYLNKSLPLKVDFDRFSADQRMDGLNKINLHSLVNEEEDWEWPSDPVADYVSYNAMRAHGVPASRAVMAEVYINEVSQGIYAVVEQVDGRFVRCNFDAPFGDLYKPGHSLEYEGDSIAQYPHIGHKWPDESDHKAVLALMQGLTDGTSDSLADVLDVDGALSYFAMNIGLGNWDYYTFITHNYYIYEATPGSFTVIPWDMNMSQVGWTEPCGVGAGDDETPLSNRLLADPQYVTRYKEILREFLEGPGSEQSQHQLVDEIEPLVEGGLPNGRLEELKENISTRVAGLLANLDELTVCPEETEWE